MIISGSTSSPSAPRRAPTGADRARLPDLSFCPVFLDDVLKIDAVTAVVNYGVNRVRFPAPVPVGSRIRGHVRLVSAEQKPAGLECAFGILVELEGSDRPACVIETVVIYR